MDPTTVGTVIVVCTFGGALVGIWLRGSLPEAHLNGSSTDTIKLGIGLIATMTALVLGLVTASAKSSFDSVNTAVRHTAIDILTLDRLLARYGPETGEIRKTFQRAVGRRIDMIWAQGSRSANVNPLGSASEVEGLVEGIRSLKARDDSQRALQSRAVESAEALLQIRWLAVASTVTSVPLPFLVVLVCWLTATFTSFGLTAPRNATVLVVLFVCAMSVGSAVFLILEMDGPFDGLLKVSAEPLRHAHALLNQ